MQNVKFLRPIKKKKKSEKKGCVFHSVLIFHSFSGLGEEFGEMSCFLFSLFFFFFFFSFAHSAVRTRRFHYLQWKQERRL